MYEFRVCFYNAKKLFWIIVWGFRQLCQTAKVSKTSSPNRWECCRSWTRTSPSWRTSRTSASWRRRRWWVRGFRTNRSTSSWRSSTQRLSSRATWLPGRSESSEHLWICSTYIQIVYIWRAKSSQITWKLKNPVNPGHLVHPVESPADGEPRYLEYPKNWQWTYRYC